MVWGSEFRVEGLEFDVWGLVLRVWGLGVYTRNIYGPLNYQTDDKGCRSPRRGRQINAAPGPENTSESQNLSKNILISNIL